MRHLRLPIVLSGAAAVAAVAVGTAVAAHVTAFSATFAGTATEKISGQTVTSVGNGKGSATLLGRSTVSGTVTANTSNPPCAPFNGPASIASPKGKLKLNVLPTSRGCAASEDDKNNVSLAGSVKVIGGTAKFKKARGTLRFTGHYDRGSGAFTLKLKGTLTY